MKRKTRLLLVVSLVTAIATKAFAQPSKIFDERVSNTNSNSFKATANTVRNDADYCMDPRYFQNVNFDDSFMLLNVDGQGQNLDLDFVKKFNNIYLGLNYNGNLWGKGDKIKSDPVKLGNTTTTTVTSSNKNNNSFDIIFGIGNFGAKLYFDINPETTKTTTYTTTTTTGIFNQEPTTTTTEDRKKTKSNTFTFLGSLAYSLELSPFTLKPLASFGYYGASTKNDETKNGTFLMNIGSDFVFGNKDKEQIAGVFYSLDLGKTKATISQATISNPTNIVNLYYKSNFDLGSKADLGIRVNFKNTFINTTTKDKNGEITEKVFNYNLSTDFSIGVRANVTSSFNVDCGLNVGLPYITHESTTPTNGIKTYTTTTNCVFPTTLSAGFDWNLGKNWTLDMSAMVPINSETKSLLSNINLGVSYRK